MSGRRKRLAQSRIRRARKRELTEKQIAKDRKYWACGRKVIYVSEVEAQRKADELGQTAYKCEYGAHFHTAHLPGSQRFVRPFATA